MKAVMYGAGNIGRGFIGQLLSQSGYEVVFVDVDVTIVESMNHDGAYPIRVVSPEGVHEVQVNNIRAVNGLDSDLVAAEIADVSLMATAVGVNILPRIVPNLVKGLRLRWQNGNKEPLNIIICENLMDANEYLRELINHKLTDGEQVLFRETVGLVEASIGRMVPIMTDAMREGNPLRVWVEPYCELPVDKDGFKGGIPQILNMKPVSPFLLYIQRKLFLHNMGHAVTAYLGHLASYKTIYEAISNPVIRNITAHAMLTSAKALSLEHKVSYDELQEHANDLIARFGNQYLGDTIERVGRDTFRKLSKQDRFAGAVRLCYKNGVDPMGILMGLVAALRFNQENDPGTQKVQEALKSTDLRKVIIDICGIKEEKLLDKISGIDELIVNAGPSGDVLESLNRLLNGQ